MELDGGGGPPRAQSSPKPGANSSLKVKCPQCLEDVEIETEVDWTQVTCQSCGSSFGLLGPETEGSQLQPGHTIARFELIRCLGEGGFGTVWEAFDPQLDRTVALKLPRRGDLTAAEAELFLREARAAAQIRHPHIVAIHEVGRVDDRIYLVSDFIDGRSLAERLKQGRLPLSESIELVALLAEALQQVHDHGVVHRDLKPGNILIDAEGQPHVTDFGLARRLATDLTLTMDGQVVGTPAYMSPEQASGASRSVDHLCDVYALGVILYELVAGELPFQGTPQAMVRQVLEDEPRSLRRLNPRASRDLETICARCMSKSPHRRYPSAGLLAADLRRLQRGEPIQARPVGQLERWLRWSRRRPFAAALIATLVAVAVIGPLVAMRYRELARQESTARQRAQSLELQRREELYTSRMMALQRACEANDMVRAGQLLNSTLPQDGDADFRGFEWYYWRDTTRRGLLWELGPFQRLRASAVSPDGGTIAFGHEEGPLTLYEPVGAVTTHFPLQDDSGQTLLPYSLAFSPNGRWLAIGTEAAEVLVMDMQSKEITHNLATEGDWVQDVEFSQSGELLAAAVHENGSVELWNDLDPATHRVIKASEHSLRSLALSPNATRVATVGGPYFGPLDGELRVFDVQSGTLIARRDTEIKRGWGLAFSPDAQRLFNPWVTVEELDVESLATRRAFAIAGKANVDAIALTPDGDTIVGGGKDGTLNSWNVSSGELDETWAGHLDQVFDISLFADGTQMVTTGLDGQLKCWKLHATHAATWLHDLPSSVHWLQFSHDGKVVYLWCRHPAGDTIQARNADKGKLLWESEVPVAVVQLDPRERWIVAALRSGELAFLDTATGQEVDRKREHREDRIIESCAISADGRYLFTGDGRVNPDFADTRSEEILVWDLATREPLARWNAHDRRVGQLHFDAKRQQLISYGWDKCCRRWRLDGELVAEYPMGAALAIWLGIVEESDTLVAVDAKGWVWRWSLATGEAQPPIVSRAGGATTALLFHRDHSLIIPVGPANDNRGEPSQLKFIDVRTWEPKMQLDIGPSATLSLAMSPDGEVLLTGTATGSIRRWTADRE